MRLARLVLAAGGLSSAAAAAGGGPVAGPLTGWDGGVHPAARFATWRCPAGSSTLVAASASATGGSFAGRPCRAARHPSVAFDGTTDGVSADGRLLCSLVSESTRLGGTRALPCFARGD